MSVSPSLQNLWNKQAALAEAELISTARSPPSPLSPFNSATSTPQVTNTPLAVADELTHRSPTSIGQAAKASLTMSNELVYMSQGSIERIANAALATSEELNALFGLEDTSPEFPMFSQARKPSSQQATTNISETVPAGFSQWKPLIPSSPVKPNPVQQAVHPINNTQKTSNEYNPEDSLANFTNIPQPQDNPRHPNPNPIAEQEQIHRAPNYPQSQQPHHPQYLKSYNNPGSQNLPSHTYADPENLPSYDYASPPKRQRSNQQGAPHSGYPRPSHGPQMPPVNQPQFIDPSLLSQTSSRRPVPATNIPQLNPQAIHPVANLSSTAGPQLDYLNRPRNIPQSRFQRVPQGTNPSLQHGSSSRNMPRPSLQGPPEAINPSLQYGSSSRNTARPRLQRPPETINPSLHHGSSSRKRSFQQMSPEPYHQAFSVESDVAMEDEEQYYSPEEDSDASDSESGFENPHRGDRRIPYTRLESAPEPWGPFAYNNYGELSPKKLFSTDDILQYLYFHPTHNTQQGYTPLSGGLSLWLQRTPTRSVRRCGDPLAARCRFQDCPSKQNMIADGEMRVAFDEYTKGNSTHNPQHMAGYVHLRCLERFTEFPSLCKDLNVVAEGRILPSEPHGRNKMILRSHAELIHAERFIDFCRREGRPPRTYSSLDEGTRASNQCMLQEELDGFKDAQMNITLQRRWEQYGKDGVDRGRRVTQRRKAKKYMAQKKQKRVESPEEAPPLRLAKRKYTKRQRI